jgi:hypothetical protein
VAKARAVRKKMYDATDSGQFDVDGEPLCTPALHSSFALRLHAPTFHSDSTLRPTRETIPLTAPDTVAGRAL